jgi:hypothetical protein
MVHPKTFEVVAPPTPKTNRPQGLFDGLLGGEPAVLLQDAAENPGKYDDQTVGLLNELVQGSKKKADLEEAEHRLLDHATLDFASYVKPKTAAKQPQRATRKSEDELEGMFEEGLSEADMDVPEGTTAYWWL